MMPAAKSFNAMGSIKQRFDNDALIRQYNPWVRRLAQRMIVKLPPSVEIDDLIQAGLIGLSDALSRFDVSQGVEFEAFAAQRIRGAMIDELRDIDWVSRNSRRDQKKIEKIYQQLQQKLGRSPIESEVAKAMNMTLIQYQNLSGKTTGTQLVYLEDLCAQAGNDDAYLDRHVQDTAADPAKLLGDSRKRTALIAAIQVLPQREQSLMSMYYEQDMNLKEIAVVLGVTESRVCQLHGQLIARLRCNLKAH